MVEGDFRFITDINSRERERFAAGLQMMIQAAEQMLAALASEDDAQLLIPSMQFMYSFTIVQDLFRALATATSVDVSDLDKPMEGGVTGDGTNGD